MKLRIWFFATLALITVSCHKRVPPPELPQSSIQMAREGEIESVVFLVGDVGNATSERSPLPHRLKEEVERWSRLLPQDSSVAVLFLGDNIYPKGLRLEPLYFAADSAKLQAQVDVLTGPNARAKRAFGLFIAGNHDYGHRPGSEGEARLRNEEEFLARRRARGVRVQLLPRAGNPLPGVVDTGRHLTFILIDTAWWLLSADKAEKARTMKRVEEAMMSARANNRAVIMAAHHPMKSAGAHSASISLFKGFGVYWLFKKSGAQLQDLNSLPYRDLQNQLYAIFKRIGPPFMFVGGHDHSLQLMKAVNDVEPRFMAVSGAGSKSSKIGYVPGMIFRNEGPGFMQLVLKKDGTVDMFIFTAPAAYLMCDSTAASTMAACVQKGAGEFDSRYSLTLK
jgi:hypothetical protein